MTFEVRTQKYKHKKDVNAEVKRIFTELGVERVVGEGAFSTVYATKRGFVVKRIWDCQLDKYPTFVGALAEEPQPNRLFPVIHGALILSNPHKSYAQMLVAQERLAPLTDYVTAAEADALCAKIERQLNLAMVDDGTRVRPVAWKNGTVTAAQLKHAARVIPVGDDIVYDLHSNNVMVRDGTQLVLTDPVC